MLVQPLSSNPVERESLEIKSLFRNILKTYRRNNRFTEMSNVMDQELERKEKKMFSNLKIN